MSELNFDWGEALADIIEKYSEAGCILRSSRRRSEKTQQELADEIGTPQRHISEMEHGKRPIGKEMAKRLAKALNVNYRIFL